MFESLQFQNALSMVISHAMDNARKVSMPNTKRNFGTAGATERGLCLLEAVSKKKLASEARGSHSHILVNDANRAFGFLTE